MPMNNYIYFEGVLYGGRQMYIEVATFGMKSSMKYFWEKIEGLERLPVTPENTEKMRFYIHKFIRSIDLVQDQLIQHRIKLEKAEMWYEMIVDLAPKLMINQDARYQRKVAVKLETDPFIHNLIKEIPSVLTKIGHSFMELANNYDISGHQLVREIERMIYEATEVDLVEIFERFFEYANKVLPP